VPDLRRWATPATLTLLTVAVWAQHRRAREDGETIRLVRSIVIATGSDVRAMRIAELERDSGHA
jgi:hypothetical protein